MKLTFPELYSPDAPLNSSGCTLGCIAGFGRQTVPLAQPQESFASNFECTFWLENAARKLIARFPSPFHYGRSMIRHRTRLSRRSSGSFQRCLPTGHHGSGLP